MKSKARNTKVRVARLQGQGREKRQRNSFPRMERILVPIDFSGSSKQALEYAVTFARRFKARLVLLHVVDLYPVDYMLGITRNVDENTRVVAQAETKLGILAQKCGWAATETTVRLGKPYQEIINAARERRSQLVIMGTHGYTGFLHFELGSTAERVLRAAPCPVLVVRQVEHEAESPGVHSSMSERL